MGKDPDFSAVIIIAVFSPENVVHEVLVCGHSFHFPLQKQKQISLEETRENKTRLRPRGLFRTSMLCRQKGCCFVGLKMFEVPPQNHPKHLYLLIYSSYLYIATKKPSKKPIFTKRSSWNDLFFLVSSSFLSFSPSCLHWTHLTNTPSNCSLR